MTCCVLFTSATYVSLFSLQIFCKPLLQEKVGIVDIVYDIVLKYFNILVKNTFSRSDT